MPKIGGIRTVGCLSCSDHAMVEFTLLRDIRQARSTIRKLNFRKASFQLCRELVNITPWESVLKGKGAEQVFKEGRCLRKISLGHKSSPSPDGGS